MTGHKRWTPGRRPHARVYGSAAGARALSAAHCMRLSLCVCGTLPECLPPCLLRSAPVIPAPLPALRPPRRCAPANRMPPSAQGTRVRPEAPPTAPLHIQMPVGESDEGPESGQRPQWSTHQVHRTVFSQNVCRAASAPCFTRGLGVCPFRARTDVRNHPPLPCRRTAAGGAPNRFAQGDGPAWHRLGGHATVVLLGGLTLPRLRRHGAYLFGIPPSVVGLRGRPSVCSA